MRCPECRQPVEGAPTTCPHCGATLPRPKGRRCPTCGAPVSRRAEQCFLCGADLGPAPRPAWRWLADLLVVAVVVGIIAAWYFLPARSRQAPVALATATLTATRPPSTATYTPTAVPPTPTPASTPTPTASATPRPAVVTHKVEPGDTLYELAERYGVSVAAIRQASGLAEGGLLRVGQVLTIPLAGPSEGGAVEEAPLPTATPYTYVVQPGDSLSSIAALFGTTVADLMALNNLKSADFLRAGQELVVPGPPPTPGPATDTPTPLPTDARIYVVQPGDTLLSIAQDYGASMQVLMTVNRLEDPSLLRVGQELIILPGTPTPEPTDTPLPPPTATPGPPFPAPMPLWPPDGAAVAADLPALVSWTSVGLLAEGQWYLVRIWPADTVGAEPVVEVLLKETSWHLPPNLAPEPGQPARRYRWEVWVVQAEVAPEPEGGGMGASGAEVGGAGHPPLPLMYLSAPGPSRILVWGS